MIPFDEVIDEPFLISLKERNLDMIIYSTSPNVPLQDSPLIPDLKQDSAPGCRTARLPGGVQRSKRMQMPLRAPCAGAAVASRGQPGRRWRRWVREGSGAELPFPAAAAAVCAAVRPARWEKRFWLERKTWCFLEGVLTYFLSNQIDSLLWFAVQAQSSARAAARRKDGWVNSPCPECFAPLETHSWE